MVDVSEKARQIIQHIRKGNYLCINRPRQYYVISTSFQDTGQEEFRNDSAFVSYFTDLLAEQMEGRGFPDALTARWSNPSARLQSWESRPFSFLRRKIRELCEEADHPIVLMIDEADSASSSEVFQRFLGVLRESCLASRKKSMHEASFQSVILAGVTDFRNLNVRIRPDENPAPDSPWNIAAEFDVDMSFTADEIAGMLLDYEADHPVNMDVSAVSRELRRLTSGYPYIVSWLCNWIDTRGNKNWTVEGITKAGYAFRHSDDSAGQHPGEHE